MQTLTEKLDMIVDGYYGRSELYTEVKEALAHYEKIITVAKEDSLASDGLEMIQAAMRNAE